MAFIRCNYDKASQRVVRCGRCRGSKSLLGLRLNRLFSFNPGAASARQSVGFIRRHNEERLRRMSRRFTRSAVWTSAGVQKEPLVERPTGSCIFYAGSAEKKESLGFILRDVDRDKTMNSRAVLASEV